MLHVIDEKLAMVLNNMDRDPSSAIAEERLLKLDAIITKINSIDEKRNEIIDKLDARTTFQDDICYYFHSIKAFIRNIPLPPWPPWPFRFQRIKTV